MWVQLDSLNVGFDLAFVLVVQNNANMASPKNYSISYLFKYLKQNSVALLDKVASKKTKKNKKLLGEQTELNHFLQQTVH